MVCGCTREQEQECLGQKPNTPCVSEFWFPEHRGIDENHKANIRAKKSSRDSFIGPETFCDLGDCTYKHELKLKEEHENQEPSSEQQITGFQHF